jgi:hypothetical protein
MQRVIVRCSQGGLFSTIPLPLVSLKAIRLGTSRLQRCPIHRKWERVRQVAADTLTDQERRDAAANVDGPIP